MRYSKKTFLTTYKYITPIKIHTQKETVLVWILSFGSFSIKKNMLKMMLIQLENFLFFIFLNQPKTSTKHCFKGSFTYNFMKVTKQSTIQVPSTSLLLNIVFFSLNARANKTQVVKRCQVHVYHWPTCHQHQSVSTKSPSGTATYLHLPVKPLFTAVYQRHITVYNN